MSPIFSIIDLFAFIEKATQCTRFPPLQGSGRRGWGQMYTKFTLQAERLFQQFKLMTTKLPWGNLTVASSQLHIRMQGMKGVYSQSMALSSLNFKNTIIRMASRDISGNRVIIAEQWERLMRSMVVRQNGGLQYEKQYMNLPSNALISTACPRTIYIYIYPLSVRNLGCQPEHEKSENHHDHDDELSSY